VQTYRDTQRHAHTPMILDTYVHAPFYLSIYRSIDLIHRYKFRNRDRNRYRFDIFVCLYTCKYNVYLCANNHTYTHVSAHTHVRRRGRERENGIVAGEARCTQRVLRGYSGGTPGVLEGPPAAGTRSACTSPPAGALARLPAPAPAQSRRRCGRG
jgi:hypothetical protein